MRTKNTLKAIPLVVALMYHSFISCKKDESGTNTISGSIKLEITAKHHTWGVGGLSVFLKENTTLFPGYDTSLYTRRTTTDSLGKSEFNSLFPGDFYVYAIGYDSIWGDSVIGYMPVTIKNQTLVDNTMNIELYVSE